MGHFFSGMAKIVNVNQTANGMYYVHLLLDRDEAPRGVMLPVGQHVSVEIWEEETEEASR